VRVAVLQSAKFELSNERAVLKCLILYYLLFKQLVPITDNNAQWTLSCATQIQSVSIRAEYLRMLLQNVRGVHVWPSGARTKPSVQSQSLVVDDIVKQK